MPKILRQSSSLSTIFSISNQMLGIAMLTFPIIFRDAGLFSSLLVCLTLCIIMFITCRLYVIHCAEEDEDVQDSVKRILGIGWQKYYRLLTGLCLMLYNIFYIDVIVDQIYSIVYFITAKSGNSGWVASKDAQTMVWDKFSLQYMTLILMPFLCWYSFIRNLNRAITIAAYGMLINIPYFGFLLYQLVRALADGTIRMEQITWFTFDIGKVAGNCAAAFTIHIVIVTIIKANIRQDKNVRDLACSYALTLGLYCIYGIIGALPIVGNKCENVINNCFAEDWSVLVLEVSYLFSVVTAFPITLSIGRNRCLSYCFHQITADNVKYFSLIFFTIATIFSILSPYLPIDLLLTLIGGAGCFYFVYLLPTMMHFKCLYPSTTRRNQNTVISESQAVQTALLGDGYSCVHEEWYKEARSRSFRLAYLGVLNVFGIFVMIYGIVSIF